MTCVDIAVVPNQGPLVAGHAYDRITRTVELLTGVGRTQRLDFIERHASAQRTPLEENLRAVQEAISDFSMHLPVGFASGLTRQFANMMDEDEWEDGDVLIDLDALNTFLVMLHYVQPIKRPGIGTNGKGAISAFWRADGNRLTATCLPSSQVTWVLTYINTDGEKERAAGNCRPSRVAEVLAPYNPGSWFGQ